MTDVVNHFGTCHKVNDLNRRTDKPISTIKRTFTENNMTTFKQLLCDRNLSETLSTDCLILNSYESLNIFNEDFLLPKIRFNKKYAKHEP